MKITRLGGNKGIEEEVKIIDVEVNGIEYRLSEEFGRLTINTPDGNIFIKPQYSNQIAIVVED